MRPDEAPAWETSKENVVPLKEGRRIGCLNAALGVNPKAVSNEQKIKEFEDIIANYYNYDDPLGCYQDYINWLRETYPGDTKQAQLLALYEKCARHFQFDERYKDDSRYVRIWILYGDSLRDPGDLLQFMYSRDIGTKRAVFYIAWAMYLEKKGDLKRADEVYREGLARKARPEDKLKSLHVAFQQRMVESIRANGETGLAAGGLRSALGDENARPVLGVLQEKRAPLQPRAASQASDLGGGSKRKPVDSRGAAVVYEGDDVPMGLGGGQWSDVPNMNFKENARAPGPWTKERVKQQRDALAPISKPTFEIYEDEDADAARPDQQGPRSALDQQILRPKRSRLEDSPAQFVAPPNPALRRAQNTILGPKPGERLVGMAAMYSESPLSIEEIRAKHPRYAYTKPPPQPVHSLDRTMVGHAEDMDLSTDETDQVDTHQVQEHAPVAAAAPIVPAAVVGGAAEKEANSVGPIDEELTSRLKKHMSFEEPTFYQQTPASARGPVHPPRFSSIVPTQHQPTTTLPAQETVKPPTPPAPAPVDSIYHDPTMGGVTECEPTMTVRTLARVHNALDDVFDPDRPLAGEEDDEDDEDGMGLPAPDMFTQGAQANIMSMNFFAPPPVRDSASGPEPLNAKENNPPAHKPAPTEAPLYTVEPVMPRAPLQEAVVTPMGDPGAYEVMPDDDPAPIGQDDAFEIYCDPTVTAHVLVGPARPVLGQARAGAGGMQRGGYDSMEDQENRPMGLKTPSVPPMDRAAEEKKKLSPIQEALTEHSNRSLHEVSGAPVVVPFGTGDSLALATWERHADLAGLMLEDESYWALPTPCPGIAAGNNGNVSLVQLGELELAIDREMAAERAGLRCYQVSTMDGEDGEDFDPTPFVLKVTSTPCPWEYRMVNTYKARLDHSGLGLKDFMKQAGQMSVVEAYYAFVYEDACATILDYPSHGTLQELGSKYGAGGSCGLQVELVAYVAVALLRAIEALRHCQLIHTNITPDTVYILVPPAEECNVDCVFESSGGDWHLWGVQLAGLGQGIDTTLHPVGTRFTGCPISTQQEGMQMRWNEPWAYEADTLCVLDCVHTMLLGRQMQLTRTASGQWAVDSDFSGGDVWGHVFSVLCGDDGTSTAPLDTARHALESFLAASPNTAGVRLMLADNLAV